MGVWTHIILEGYCLFDSMSKKKYKYCDGKDLLKKSKDKWKTMKNKNYIPKSERPNWCKNQNKKLVPQFRCLGIKPNNICPFFGHCNAERKTYKILYKNY